MRIEDVCTFFTDGDWIESKDQSGSGIRLIQTGNIGEGRFLNKSSRAKYISQETFERLKCTEVLPGDILVSRLPEPVGRACIVPSLCEKMITAVDCTICRPDSNKVQKEYLCYFMRSNAYYSRLLGSVAGTTRKRISRKNLGNVEIELPVLSKQKTVVEELDCLVSIIDARWQQLQQLDELIKARFVELTEMAPTTPTRMGDIATYLNGYAFKPDQWEDKGLPIIRIQNLNNPDAAYNYYSGELAEKYLVYSGDVLVSWATHLEAYVWKGESAWLNQHIFKVVFDKMDVDKIYFVFATEEALRQAFKNAHGFKPTMEHIKKADFDNAVVKLPPLPVQREFSRFAQQVDKSKVAVQAALDEAQFLFDSLMQKYFG